MAGAFGEAHSRKWLLIMQTLHWLNEKPAHKSYQLLANPPGVPGSKYAYLTEFISKIVIAGQDNSRLTFRFRVQILAISDICAEC